MWCFRQCNDHFIDLIFVDQARQVFGMPDDGDAFDIVTHIAIDRPNNRVTKLRIGLNLPDDLLGDRAAADPLRSVTCQAGDARKAGYTAWQFTYRTEPNQ